MSELQVHDAPGTAKVNALNVCSLQVPDVCGEIKPSTNRPSDCCSETVCDELFQHLQLYLNQEIIIYELYLLIFISFSSSTKCPQVNRENYSYIVLFVW